MATPLLDHTGWQITPTLHKSVNSTTDLAKITLPLLFAVCVIGASGVIGADIAYAHARVGASSLVSACRDVTALDAVADVARRVARNEGLPIHVAVYDIMSDSDVSLLSEVIRREIGQLDVLAIDAGLWGQTAIRVTEGSTQRCQVVIDIDVIGAYLAAHHLLSILLASKDRTKAVVAIYRTGAWITDGPFAHAAFCVNKLAWGRLVEDTANDIIEEGVLVVAVYPECV